MSITAMKQALEALTDLPPDPEDYIEEAITALRAAIAEAESQPCKYPKCPYPCPDLPDCRDAEKQEPVALRQFRKKGCADWYDGHADHQDGGGPYEERTVYTAPPAAQPKCTCPSGATLECMSLANCRLNAAQPAPVQEPKLPEFYAELEYNSPDWDVFACVYRRRADATPELVHREQLPRQAPAAQPAVPEGWELVLVPKLTPRDEPDWDAVRAAAEEVTGLKVERHTYSIVVREVRKWLAAQRQPLTLSQLAKMLAEVGADPDQQGGWELAFARAIETAHGIGEKGGAA